MKKFTLLLFCTLLCVFAVNAQKFSYTGNWGKAGYNLVDSKTNAVQLIYSVPEFSMEDILVQGATMKNITLPGTFLFNDAGMPNLPGKGAYIAIPTGAKPTLRIVSQRTETIHNVEIAPAMRIPLDNQPDFSLEKNQSVYSKNSLYPASPVQMSEVQQLRGTEAVLIGVTPFQYNPVTKDLIIFQDLKIDISFTGGTGHIGNDAFRNRWFDPILEDNILNYSSLPVIDYDSRFQTYTKTQRDQECEYIIISPTGPDFLSWADSIANFRNQQGILTHVYTLTEVGGNTEAAIESFIDNAYNTWTIKPVACLLLGDYGTDATKNIISHLYQHPDSYPDFASDNKFADVTGDEMPDVVFARMPVNNANELQIMCSKFLSYERNPPVDPSFYDKPITALGWQTERWFQLCSEIVGGYFRDHGKHPRRINAIYQGTPGSIWSSATNTSAVVNYFGPSGLNYIPQTPAEMPCCWSGGTATKINAAIDSGAFLVQHRDHGAYTLWGEPAYSVSNATSLNNTALTFVFSINCETGAYQNGSTCLGEAFIRHFKNGHNAGALGAVCPTEVSYSFVNDAFTWGMYDNMWPDFMPNEGTQPSARGVRPAFGNAAGKYFLKRTNWPYNTGNKQVTYRLFHMLGDAFSVLYYEIPQQLTVTHDTEIPEGATSFNISTTDSAFVSLTVNNQIIATGYGMSSGIVITIPPQSAGTQVLVTVTKQNYYRYSNSVPVTNQQITANFIATITEICSSSTIDYNDLSTGQPETWSWTFDGGVPATSDLQNPAGIRYDTPGNYSVTLTIGKTGQDPQTLTKTEYIHVLAYPVADFAATVSCAGTDKSFTDMSAVTGGLVTSWEWDFGDPSSGTNNVSDLQNPIHNYAAPGTYNVSLTVKNNGLCTQDTMKTVSVVSIPSEAAVPTGTTELCQGITGTLFTTPGAEGALTYLWEVLPAEAGIITGNGLTATLDLSAEFSGAATVKVKGINDCGEGANSPELPLNVKANLLAPTVPTGTATVCQGITGNTFTIDAVAGATSYQWLVLPAEAGTITGTGLTATLDLSAGFVGPATIKAKAVDECGEGPYSPEVTLTVKPNPLAPAIPTGVDNINTHEVISTDFSTTGGEFAESYEWFINPSAAGIPTGTGTMATISWTQDYRGNATITVKSINNCGQSPVSEGKTVTLFSTLGISNTNSGYGVEVFPNPNNGKFILKFNKAGNFTVSITIVDAIGNRIFTENNVKISSGNSSEVIDLSNLSQGVYNLKVEGSEGIDIKKIIIRK